MNREEIMRILPHRENMLLVDEAEEAGGVAHGKYKVRGNEWFLQGHFPGRPVVPGVILCEMMAQVACVLLPQNNAAEIMPYFTGLDHVRFKNPVLPGDTLLTECVITKSKGNFFFAAGKGYVDGKLCVSGDFSFILMTK